VLFFVAVSNLDKQAREWVVWALVAGATILALLGITNFFGYSLVQTDYGKLRNWTPVGNPANLSLYLALVLPLALGVVATAKNRTLQIAFLAAAIIISLPIILFKLVGPMLAAAAGLAIAAIFLSRTKLDRNTRGLMGIFLVVVTLFTLVNFVPGLRDSLLKPFLAKDEAFNVTADRALPLSSAWKISTQSVGQRPFLGVGPGTFAYSYTAFKGQELNSDEFWNLRFDLSGNEYLTVLSTLGIVGLITFVLILALLARSLLTFAYRSEIVKENATAVFLLGSFLAFVVGIFFQDTTASIWVFFALFAALVFTYFRDAGVRNVEQMDVKFVALTSGGLQFVEPSDRANRDSTIGTVITIIGVVALLAVLAFGYPGYQAEVNYQKALVASSKDQAADTRNELLAAINKNPNRDTYRRSLVVLDRVLATNLSRKEDKNEQDNRNIAGLVNESIEQGVRITGYQGRGLNNFSIRKDAGTSPLNVANWEALSGVLNSLELEGELKQRNAADAINVAQQAVALDPRNPVLLESLGSILMKNNLVDNAIQSYEQAIRVRPAYASAHYNLATALRQKGDNPQRVVFELESTLTLLPEDSPDRERVTAELEEAKKKRDEATSSATQ
jgi:tetratricopeptide (TPR) repeat protein